jgi:uncharacterized membrane protein (UPF0127 family)
VKAVVSYSVFPSLNLKARIAETIWQRAKGLMFSQPQAMLFLFPYTGYHPIHSFFVNFSFYAYYMHNNVITDVKGPIKPFTPFLINKRPANQLLEVPYALNVKAGDRLEWFRLEDPKTQR